MILVTGGAGLLGKELIQQLLAQGKAVTAIYNNTPLSLSGAAGLTTVQCNILDTAGLEEVMAGVQQVYHCAAIVSFDPKKKQQLFKINIEGTANVVNAAIDAGVKKIVHVSSVAALGRIREGQTITEAMNWTEETSNSSYGKSKYLGEVEVWRGMGEGLEAVVVNPSIILGAGNWESGSSKIFKTVYDEFPWYTEGVTGFVDAADVAKAMILLMESNISGERFILSAENKSYRDVFNMIANAFGKKQPHKKVTPFIASIVWRLEALKSRFTSKEPLVTSETAKTALTKVYFDNSKLKKALPGFEYLPLETSVADICNALKKINHIL
jgi:dihydroflavonol-4-reductase